MATREALAKAAADAGTDDVMAALLLDFADDPPPSAGVRAVERVRAVAPVPLPAPPSSPPKIAGVRAAEERVLGAMEEAAPPLRSLGQALGSGANAYADLAAADRLRAANARESFDTRTRSAAADLGEKIAAVEGPRSTSQPLAIPLAIGAGLGEVVAGYKDATRPPLEPYDVGGDLEKRAAAKVLGVPPPGVKADPPLGLSDAEFIAWWKEQGGQGEPTRTGDAPPTADPLDTAEGAKVYLKGAGFKASQVDAITDTPRLIAAAKAERKRQGGP